MPREEFTLSNPGFIADANSIVRRQGGVQIDWANVPDDFINADTGNKEISAGYPLSEPDDFGQAIPRGEDGEDAPVAVGLLETNAVENDRSAAKTGYGLIIGGAVIENRLPIELTSDMKTELAAAGTGFAFQTTSNTLSD